jgi:hypothetical protein
MSVLDAAAPTMVAMVVPSVIPAADMRITEPAVDGRNVTGVGREISLVRQHAAIDRGIVIAHRTGELSGGRLRRKRR